MAIEQLTRQLITEQQARLRDDFERHHQARVASLASTTGWLRRATAASRQLCQRMRRRFASNKTENHELLMLSLHLLQVSLVYINTLMIQQVLAQPAWQGRLTARDLRALTPLKWAHINPYGTFLLDMQQRLRLELAA